MKSQIVSFFVLLMFVACSSPKESGITEQPTLADYQVGEKWVWKYKGVTTAGEVRSDGTDTRTIVSTDGVLGMTIGKDTIPVSDIVKPEASETPKYDWPLEVGKKWKYENSWTSQDGTTGKQSQDAEVLSYQEETVEAGTFMAYTIQYAGKTTNSRGYSADEKEVWLYAPAVKTFIKLTQDQGDFHYVEELIEYSKPE
ncbi:hypothetical protein MATR_32420 [Marivirga tractuosa]|uniref:Lipoprotein n=1 Tax=Marivirga tractuosa (strain ATCC 23168 / DSM 4126 / NBRC 15989 / NCIMB 1408 / VKM B-1430 / H-43) TaxID=643867 RepID=E4TSW8_MARTH|nr:hypothetical protein [Marivirga tractuosa]ADR22909.1 hypothetical protein Ftrac_2933 [Marivirga tractuosa DSM 4126]BDD16417.1 hypothetical protein MATR_32420 [Marivirga tractuosa]